jgi:hypothetical protein
MADATNRVSSGTIVTYQTDSDLKAAIDFHKENMPASNWTYDEANSMVSDQFATLVFTRQGQTAQVTLTPNGSGGVMVMANIGP